MISTVISGLVLMKKRKAMELFSPSFRKSWKVVELRVLAVVSLVVQLVLIVLGKRRRHIPDRWIRVVVWSAYLLADSVATLALGILSNDLGEIYEDGGKLDSDNELTAFWAPFFLVHLGGPDTITAYSLEDNELYLRHLFGLIVQIVVTVYILLMAWTSSRLSFLYVTMIVVGSIKYGERTWALWKASSDELQDSMLSSPDHGPNYAKLMDEYSLRQTEGFFVQIEEVKEVVDGPARTATADDLPQGNIIKAYTMFQIFKRLFADLILSYQEQEKSQSLFKTLSPENAFDVIAIELGFIYDMLYTKATVIYTGWGLVRRFVTFSLTCIVLVIFSFDDLQKYKVLDIVITFLLLGGAILLETYAAFTLCFSDHAKHWLIEHRQIKISRAINQIELVKLPRWSECMGQYSLLSLCLNEKPGLWPWGKLNKKLGRLLEKLHYKFEEPFEEGLRNLIFRHVKKKFEQLEKKKGDHADLRDLCNRRGNSILKHYNQHPLEWSVSCEFDQSILIWHIATEICYHKQENVNDLDEKVKTNRTMSRLISSYMLYLLAVYPSMLPAGIGLIRLRDTRAEAEKFFEERLSTSKKEKKSIKEAIEKMLQVRTHVLPIKVKGDRSKSVLFDGCRLASSLEKITDKRVKWKMIRDVWLEMLTFAANQCEGWQHANQLRRGGELLTHVWLLMAHFGIIEQFQISKGHARALLFTK